MISAGLTAGAAGPIPPALAAVGQLETEFECAFSVFREVHAVWTRVRPETGGDDCPERLPSAAGRIATDNQPHFLPSASAGEQPLLLVPLPGPARQRCLAAAYCPGHDPALAVRLARLCLKHASSQQKLTRQADDVEAYVSQITEDFEELTFLRHLAEHLELSEVSQDAWQVSGVVLPLLGCLIKAESLVLVAAPEPPEQIAAAGKQVLAAAAAPAPNRAGSCHLPDEICQRLVAEFGPQTATQPVVKNHLADPRFPGVESLIMVHVAKGSLVLGWMLAVNRRVRRGMPEGLIGEQEFGTVEASLLSSAAGMLATHARNVQLFQEREALLVAVVRAMVCAIDAKDAYTCGHSERVALVARRLAAELGLDPAECERLYLTGLLHDVGKIGVSDSVLTKPGKLTDDEFAQIRRHPDDGWAILHELTQLNYVLPGVLHHHESYNGTGYPDSLAGDCIPRDARILAVADAFDAMSSDRPYRQGMATERVDEILRGGAGTQWDPAVIDAFFAARADINEIVQTYERPCRPPRVAAT